jgi:single-stranded DNA-binding protein
MSMFATLTGNLTKDPESKEIRDGKELFSIVELRVFSDVYRRMSDDRLEQVDEKSEGVDVTIWNERLGQAVMAHFRRGARVQVIGNLHLNRYKDRESGESRAALRMAAESVTLVPYRVDRIDFSPKRGPRDTDDAVETERDPETGIPV